jgi:2-iminobutanoate/2-iminopropanoate deaminase
MKSPLTVAGAPGAIGPYSQAQVVRLHGGNKMVWTSGQVALDPKSGALVEGSIGPQTERALKNLTAVLAGAGLELADVVKTTVFLVDMDDFAAMNEVYARHFSSSPPARTTVAVSGLPKGSRVEIEAVAIGRDL